MLAMAINNIYVRQGNFSYLFIQSSGGKGYEGIMPIEIAFLNKSDILCALSLRMR